MKKKAAIIGAGQIGKALGTILEQKGVSVFFWDKDPAKAPGQLELAEIVKDAVALFLCIPSWANREALQAIKPHLNPKTIVVTLSKGIELDSRKTMDAVLAETLPSGQPYAVMGGPMMAKEMEQGRRAIAAIGASSKSAFTKLTKLFEGTLLIMEYQRDIRSVALAGVLKNIYSFFLGMSDALNWGGNVKGWLAQEALKEMAEVAKTLGMKKDAMYGTAGLGDFIGTAFSPYSRNRQAGEEVIKTGQCCLPTEGVNALPSVIALLGESAKDFLILNMLRRIIIGKEKAEAVLEELFKK